MYKSVLLSAIITCQQLCSSLGYDLSMEHPKDKSRCKCIDIVSKDGVMPFTLSWYDSGKSKGDED